MSETVRGESFATGLDVSHHQGDIDWRALASEGVAFCFIKATQGARYDDPRFADNWARAGANGVLRGAYHFLSALDPVDDQVDNFLRVVGSLEAGDLPPVVDIEEDLSSGKDRWEQVPIAERAQRAFAWLQQVERLLGRRPIIYTRRGFMAEKFGDYQPLTTYALWVAHYTKAAQPALPPGWTDWKFWQYTENGTVGGISGDVDRNIFNGSVGELSSWIANAGVWGRRTEGM